MSKARTCLYCGGPMPAFAKSFQKYCCPDHRRKYWGSRYVKSSKGIGTPFVCDCCKETVLKTGPRQRFCREKCEPKEDVKIICTCCGEPKNYDDFYDYRKCETNAFTEGGKFIPTCKACMAVKGVEQRAK